MRKFKSSVPYKINISVLTKSPNSALQHRHNLIRYYISTISICHPKCIERRAKSSLSWLVGENSSHMLTACPRSHAARHKKSTDCCIIYTTTGALLITILACLPPAVNIFKICPEDCNFYNIHCVYRL